MHALAEVIDEEDGTYRQAIDAAEPVGLDVATSVGWTPHWGMTVRLVSDALKDRLGLATDRASAVVGIDENAADPRGELPPEST